MNKKIAGVLAVILGVLFIYGPVSAETTNPLDLIKQKLLNIGNKEQPAGATGAGRGAVDFSKMMMDDAGSILKARQNSEQAQKFLTSDTGNMTPEIWIEITARLRCVDAAVVNKEQANAIMSQFGVTAAEYAAYAWQTTFKLAGDGKNAGDWNIEEINKRYEAKYNELIASGNCGIAAATTAAKGMNDEKWIEMMGLFMCLPDSEVMDVRRGWIFAKYGTAINEYVAYSKTVKARADYSGMKEKARARYWTFVGNRVCDKLNESVMAASNTLPYVPFLMDDQNLWNYLKLKFKNIGCKIGLIAGGLNCPPVPTVASGPVPLAPSTAGTVASGEPVIINHPATTAADGNIAAGPAGGEKENWLKKLKCKVKKFFGRK